MKCGHKQECPGSLVVTSYLGKTEKSGQAKALSWESMSWYSLGEDRSIAILGDPCASGK